MSVQFCWPELNDAVKQGIVDSLESSLNQKGWSSILIGPIRIGELDIGRIPPDLEILEIGEASLAELKATFKLTYSGDAKISLLIGVAGFTEPVHFTVDQLKLNAILSVHISSSQGLTVVFWTDPVESIAISSTFDAIGLKGVIQGEVESLIRQFFRNQLPSILHDESLRLMRENGLLNGETSRQRRKSSLVSERGVRIGIPTDSIDHKELLSPILEDLPLPPPYYISAPNSPEMLRDLSKDAMLMMGSRSVAGDSLGSRRSGISAATSRFSILNRGRSSSLVPVAKRMDILRRQNNSFSPFDCPRYHTGLVHRSMMKERENSSPTDD